MFSAIRITRPLTSNISWLQSVWKLGSYCTVTEGLNHASKGGFVAQLIGFPWDTGKDEISHFLNECNISGGEDGIHFTYTSKGKPNGRAFVELESEEDATRALARDRENIGTRYVEVSLIDKSQMDKILERFGKKTALNTTDAGLNHQPYVSKTGHSIHMRGLPYSATVEDIFEFFSPIQPVHCELECRRDGRSRGTAKVDFVSQQEIQEAMKRHKKFMSSRYIELFKISDTPNGQSEKSDNVQSGEVGQSEKSDN